ncbi:MAG: cytochrome b N-terminal domain-containing protein, partial [Verrucomicrobia bacterium]|nr:cytochrome b N-terminal domain-containing protein [Verrucomicrobiota bacterium]
MKKLLDWLDQRTGCKKLAHEALYENVPGGARWRYVWGSTLTFALAVQFITGIFLWMAYSPSSQTAWESVYFIQHQMTGGWLLRGIHHYTAQLMTVLLALHLMQVLIDGAYKAPREINFWTGLILLQLTLALSLTGYLLPWDQKGYWATKVATNILSIVPLIGPDLQRVIIGGADYGHHTLTRFFALHAGVIPGAIIALIAGHIYLFRKHGITAKQPYRKPDAAFWPDQVLMDSVACLAVLLTVLVLCYRTHGAELAAPADPASQFSAARPEWYFLSLFQFLKYFPGESEIWGAIVIPGLAMGILFAMPFLARWKFGHRFNLAFVVVVGLGAGLLTWRAMREDRRNPEYQKALAEAEHQAQRAVVLASAPSGIPL